MQFFTQILLLSNLMVSSVLSYCASQCLSQTKSEVDGYCSSVTVAVCQCQNYPALLQCFQNCPDEMNEMASVQNWINNICLNARQVTPHVNHIFTVPNNNNLASWGFPTATTNDLFAATTIDSNLIISASGTKVIIPFSGQPQNTNTPVVDNLYSNYNLGSISIGYKTAVATDLPNMNSLATTTSSATTYHLPLFCIIISSIILSFYLF